MLAKVQRSRVSWFGFQQNSRFVSLWYRFASEQEMGRAYISPAFPCSKPPCSPGIGGHLITNVSKEQAMCPGTTEMVALIPQVSDT